MYTFDTVPNQLHKMAKSGRQVIPGVIPSETSTKGTKEGETRKTYLVNMALANKIDQIAYTERKTVKDVIFEAMSSYIKAYEKKNGAVQLSGK